MLLFSVIACLIGHVRFCFGLFDRCCLRWKIPQRTERLVCSARSSSASQKWSGSNVHIARNGLVVIVPTWAVKESLFATTASSRPTVVHHFRYFATTVQLNQLFMCSSFRHTYFISIMIDTYSLTVIVVPRTV